MKLARRWIVAGGVIVVLMTLFPPWVNACDWDYLCRADHLRSGPCQQRLGQDQGQPRLADL